MILLSLVAQHAGNLLVVADYYANKSAYLANCENRFQPLLHCNGKCQMVKKLQKTENKANQAPGKMQWKFGDLSCKSFSVSEYIIPAKAAVFNFTPISSGVPVDISLAFFHPPSV